MGKRRAIPKATESRVLISSARRCCLCLYLKANDQVHKGQIAHLNGNAKDARFENLVYLCLEHHDEYDSTTRQSKGYTVHEVRQYRDRLYARNGATQGTEVATFDLPPMKSQDYDALSNRFGKKLSFITKPWSFPLWQVANMPELFAFKAANGADGVCLIERIDLPDGRIVIACIDPPGNPGNSITNCVEEICFQVCKEFSIPADRLVWLEHYEDHRSDWHWVRFESMPPERPFEGPTWTKMTPEIWTVLQLEPLPTLTVHAGNFYSKLRKLFSWPSEALSPLE